MNLDMKLNFNFNKRNRYKNICSIEGCNNSACGKYCNKHYHQIKRYGHIKTRTRFDKNPICWHGGLFEYKDNILTGRYFSICLLQQHDINKGWMPKPTQIIDCVEVEISPDNWIMAVDINNIDLIKLDIIYNIQWEECSCLKGIRLEDVTEELEDKAYEEMRHN